MVRVAMIEYFTTSSNTLIFFVRKGMAEPTVVEAREDALHQPFTREYMLHCAERLIVDFHGLPRDWDSESRFERYKRLLSLPPAVNAGKRKKEILQINLRNPKFAYELTYWENLSNVLLPAELRTEIADCDLLCFVPQGPLHSLPFAALRWSEQEYLIERFGICHAPSASVLRYCQSKNPRRVTGLNHQPTSCLIVAVAADKEDPQDFEADGERLADLFREQNASARVTYLVGTSKTGSTHPASKVLLQGAAAGQDIIHLACHGLFGVERNSRDPLDSGLLVSDGVAALSLDDVSSLSPAEISSHFLTAREVFDLELTADLVTLRACSSGRAEIETGDELIGLTRAFLYAGASSLIVSLWNVNKRSSQLLLNDFYRLWLDKQHPLPKWQALQQAQKNLLQNPEYQHPYHWAPFILVGDWL